METKEDLRRQLEELRAENERLRPKPKKLTAKVSRSGAVQVNNLRRFPVTFYANEWERLFTEARPLVEKVIREHGHELSRKED